MPLGRARLLLALALVALATALLALVAGPARAEEDPNAACLECHGEKDFEGERDGQKVSMYVDAAKLAASVHAGVSCADCHADLDGVTDFPHAVPLKRVECGECHEGEAAKHASSLHGQAFARGDKLAPSCAECHGSHDVRTPKDPDSPTNHMNIPLLCGKCHHEGTEVSRTHDIPQERILENYSEGMHGEGLFKKGLAVTAVCTSCHTAHEILPHSDPRSTIHRDNVAKVCTQCHVQIERVHRKVIEGKLWESEPHKIPACVDCHQPHKVRRVFYPAGVANKDCLSCHREAGLTMERDGRKVSLTVDEAHYADSAHGRRSVGCAQCHTDVDPSHGPPQRPCDTIRKPVDCAACHADQVAQYQASTHGKLHAKGGSDAEDAPTCLDCHDKHGTRSRKWPDSPTFPRNVPDLCARCHQEGKKAAVRIQGDLDIPRAYHDSIHGTALTQSGLLVVATCVSCHTAHGELPPTDPNSTVHPSRLAHTCGQCHDGVEATLKTSVHWPGNTETDEKLPTCNDCHSSHEIGRTDKDDFKKRTIHQCGKCHEEQAETFFETFHGKVSRLGSAGAAKCYDCHGTHGILPPSDPQSTLSRDNVVQTCAKCHPGSHRRFAGYLTHATHHDEKKYPWLFWTFWGMTGLLVGTLTFGLFHTGAWLTRLWLSRDQWRPHRAAALAAAKVQGVRLYRRFDRYQRMQHLVMLLSFFTLALTGMTLKFSYAGWAEFVASLLGGFESMHVMHRLGATALMCVFAAHLISVNRRRRKAGRTWRQTVFGPDSLLFNRKDLSDFLGSMKWFFGVGPRPRYGRWTYWEKFDYFAVFWGVAVIGLTGLILWFPEIATKVIPGEAVNVATIIHSDEALLAVAFIFTIHFFNTHFRPDKFPMDPVIFTGRVTLEELRHDRPEEYEALVADGTLEEHLVAPFPVAVEKGFKVFGFVALGVGLTLIGLILYAMIFQYR